ADDIASGSQDAGNPIRPLLLRQPARIDARSVRVSRSHYFSRSPIANAATRRISGLIRGIASLIFAGAPFTKSSANSESLNALCAVFVALASARWSAGSESTPLI